MDLKIYAKNLELNSEAEGYIQKKFKRLERHLKLMSDAELEVSRTSARSQTDRVVVQMTLKANGYTLRGQESGPNLFAAIDAMTDVMDRQIQRYKGKVYRSARAKKASKAASIGSGPMTQPADGEEAGGWVSDEGAVVRTKRFPMRPMTVEDAILEMKLLSHDFFLFYNVESDEYNVVYQRRDGGFGVIEPDLI